MQHWLPWRSGHCTALGRDNGTWKVKAASAMHNHPSAPHSLKQTPSEGYRAWYPGRPRAWSLVSWLLPSPRNSKSLLVPHTGRQRWMKDELSCKDSTIFSFKSTFENFPWVPSDKIGKDGKNSKKNMNITQGDEGPKPPLLFKPVSSMFNDSC